MSGGMLQDPVNAHSGQWSAHVALNSTTGNGHFYRSFTVLSSSDYQLSAWVRTVASGGQGGAGGASLIVTATESSTTTIASGSVVQTEGQWQLVQVTVNSGTNTSVNVRLDQSNFRGDAYIDDLTLTNLSDSEGVMNWAATNPGNLAGVTWRTFANGSPTSGARQISIPASTAVTDVQDAGLST